MDIPQPIVDALYSEETLGKIRAIADKYKLHLDVIGDIEAFVNLRIADKITDAELIADITITINDKDLSQKIVADVNATIFEPLKAKLKELTNQPKPMTPTGPTTQLPVVIAPTPPPTKPMSIVEQKMPPVPTVVPPTTSPAPPQNQAVQPPVRYHGTDPYREPF